ncbi:cupredoxin domain-containing protein [Halogeometricum limi]|uniref:Plastocyanin n=1 Tax=Halogeometricum limi TaxID=555875 RepID=A0A1I6GPF7_9EURY|nr:plastocyanin/azurin family copper-binding protein [Halogeometricum limi]SFR44070.1 Plastocyanin [Halogeometricum limi]
MDSTRRHVLELGVGLVSAVGLAGCLGSGDDAATTEPTETGTTAEATPTAEETPPTTATAEPTPPTTATAEPTPTASPTPEPTTSPTPEPSGESETVTLRNSRFRPHRLSVATGTAVEWRNEDGYPHNVKSTRFNDSAAEWSYFSKNFDEGESVRHRFDEPGAYEYFCTIHGTAMCGVVVVGDVDYDGTLPCE